jgi:hypothetical protein
MFDVPSPARLRTLAHDAEARVIAGYIHRHCRHRGFEFFVARTDEKPLSKNLMRYQRRELGLNGSVMLVVRTDQNPVPVPATGLRWLNEQQHLTLEEVRGKPTEHSPGKEGRLFEERFENPLVLKLFHVFDSPESARLRTSTMDHTASIRVSRKPDATFTQAREVPTEVPPAFP